MERARQSSESMELGIMLALSGGFMDAYSYIVRDGVFANAQTGNMLLLGIKLSEGAFHEAARYLFPVLFFTAGIALAEAVKTNLKIRLHWRQVSVLTEIFILAAVGLMPLDMNLIANSLTSFACGIQVESFRKIHGRSMATTMCIGNLRSATENLFNYFTSKDKEKLFSGLFYYGIIACFVIGAVIGNSFIRLLGKNAIFICAVFLSSAFIIMLKDRERGKETRKDGEDRDSQS